MTAETATRTIQLILAPVVLLSACSIFISGLLSHYAAINDRIRAMAQERVDLLRAPADGDSLVAERLAELDAQLPQLLRRHGMVHDALLAAYVSSAILVASMCAIALSALVGDSWLASLILGMFVTAVLALLVSVILISIEVRTSHVAVGFEVERVLALRRQPSMVSEERP